MQSQYRLGSRHGTPSQLCMCCGTLTQRQSYRALRSGFRRSCARCSCGKCSGWRLMTSAFIKSSSTNSSSSSKMPTRETNGMSPNALQVQLSGSSCAAHVSVHTTWCARPSHHPTAAHLVPPRHQGGAQRMRTWQQLLRALSRSSRAVCWPVQPVKPVQPAPAQGPAPGGTATMERAAAAGVSGVTTLTVQPSMN